MREQERDWDEGQQRRRFGELVEPSLVQLALAAWLLGTALLALVLGLSIP